MLCLHSTGYCNENEIVIANAIPKKNEFRDSDMDYIRAEEILPVEVVELIQQYVDGTNIYIPRKQENRQEWGTKTAYKYELQIRNDFIYKEYLSGATISALAESYFLSEKSIQRIIRQKRVSNVS